MVIHRLLYGTWTPARVLALSMSDQITELCKLLNGLQRPKPFDYPIPSDAVRTVAILDSQLLLIRRSVFASLGDPNFLSLTDEDRHELEVLKDVIDDTLKQPNDPDVLHGFCL